MNWQTINKIFRELDLHPDQKKFIGCVRFHPKESHAHRRAKFEFASDDYDNGVPFLQECWNLRRTRRYDHVRFVDNEDERIIEIECNPKVTKENVKTIRIERDS